MDTFFSQKNCDRCGGSLEAGRIMSKYNNDCICMICKKKEQKSPNYKKACDADIEAVRRGDYNFPGIGLGGGL